MIAAVYVINLAASRERWRTIQPILDVIGIPERIRFDAVDGAALDEAEMQRLRDDRRLAAGSDAFDAASRAGETGCALSHAGVLADIVARQLPTALIIEDDIALAGPHGSWRRRYAATFADLPLDWELWYLYRCLDIEHRVERLTPRLVVPWSPLGGAAYAVTLAGARMLLAATTPVRDAVDRVYAEVVRSRRIKAFAASPLLVVPGRHPSVINRANPARTWVRSGINRPPEYWPDRYLAHLGEAVPARPVLERARRAVLRRFDWRQR